MLHDESYVRIESFIVDKLLKKEFLKCRRLEVYPENEFYNCKTMKKIRNTGRDREENVIFIETDQIKSVCVHYVSCESEIVCCVPNLLYY